LLNSEGAWCWREHCDGGIPFRNLVLFSTPLECLRLTKAMQKTAEALQGVADLQEDNVSH
jgi:sorting nexin-9/18/33